MYSTFRKQNMEILQKKKIFFIQIMIKKKKKSDNITFSISYTFSCTYLPATECSMKKDWQPAPHLSFFFVSLFLFIKRQTDLRLVLYFENHWTGKISFSLLIHLPVNFIPLLISLHPTEISKKYSFLLLREKICILR